MPVTNSPLYSETYELLRAQILDGSLKPGTRLQQDEIARNLGLSRVPLREAIRRLEGERLVVVTPRRGVAIPDLTDTDLLDLYLVRLQLEPIAFRRVAEHATDDEVAVIESQVEQLQPLLAKPTEFYRAHDEIVRATLALAPGQAFNDVVTLVRERTQYLRYAYAQMPGQTDWLLDRRRIVTAAIAARRADMVELLTRMDLIQGRDALIRWRAAQSETTQSKTAGEG